MRRRCAEALCKNGSHACPACARTATIDDEPMRRRVRASLRALRESQLFSDRVLDEIRALLPESAAAAAAGV